MGRFVFYKDTCYNRWRGRVGLINKYLSLSGLNCTECGRELTIKEVEDDEGYTDGEKMCDSCIDIYN